MYQASAADLFGQLQARMAEEITGFLMHLDVEIE
jgi:hypothetical protein